MSLLFYMLFRLVITFLPRSKYLLISWLQLPSAVILETPKIKSVTISIVFPSICHEVMGPDAMILVSRTRIKLMFPALEGEVLTTGLPGKSPCVNSYSHNLVLSHDSWSKSDCEELMLICFNRIMWRRVLSVCFTLIKEHVKAVYWHPAYLTYTQSTSWETLDWKKHKLESRLLGEISITSDRQMTPPLWQKMKKN